MTAPSRLTACLLLAFSAASQVQQPAVPATDTRVVVIDPSAPAHPFPHYWEQMFGSGRAVLSLRQAYHNDLAAIKEITDFKYVRFHAIFHDEVGIYDEDAQGNPVYNFSYVDQIYDGLLAKGVQPFVELSFMPRKLAARQMLHAFWYKPNVSPPKDWGKWDDLITQLAKHLIQRYGIEEVSQWYFEVWNEPNLDFWGGEPRQSTYWTLYDHTARTLKNVSVRLRVGGPATAQAAWADAFIRHCSEHHVPVDFISSHVYGNDRPQDVFGTNEVIPRNQMVCRAVKKVHEQIQASTLPHLPLIWSEFNASYTNEPEVTDSSYMGPWLADTIRQCDGLTEMMSYWTFSDVFEEQGVVQKPFYGGFGLIAEGGIPKPAFNAFKVLHQLGNQRIDLDSATAIVTRRQNGSLAVAVWNYTPPETPNALSTVTLRFKGMAPHQASIWIVDPEHGDVRATYAKMGSPRYPTQAEIRELKQAAKIPPPVVQTFTGSDLTLHLSPYGLAVIEFK
jgi:xylan 1,4-beta-xylosidase